MGEAEFISRDGFGGANREEYRFTSNEGFGMDLG